MTENTTTQDTATQDAAIQDAATLDTGPEAAGEFTGELITELTAEQEEGPFYVAVDEVLDRLSTLGFGPVRRLEQPAPKGAVSMASLLDPDGVRVELVGIAAG